MATASNSLVASGAKKPVPFSVALASDGMQRMIASTFSNDNKAMKKFTSDIMAAYSANPNLKDCDTSTIISCGLQATALNLSISPGMPEAYIVPYGNKASFQVSVQGLVQLAIRSGMYRDIGTIEIREGELKSRDRMTGSYIFSFIEDDSVRENTPIIGFLAYFEMLNGFRKTVYFSKEKCMQWAERYSKAFDPLLFKKYEESRKSGEELTADEKRKCSSPWYENFNQMAEKTVLRQLIVKWGAKSVEMVDAFTKDDNVIRQDNGAFIVDYSSNETKKVEQKEESAETILFD